MKTFDSKNSSNTDRLSGWGYTPTFRWHRFYRWCMQFSLYDVVCVCVFAFMGYYVNKIERNPVVDVVYGENT